MDGSDKDKDSSGGQRAKDDFETTSGNETKEEGIKMEEGKEEEQDDDVEEIDDRDDDADNEEEEEEEEKFEVSEVMIELDSNLKDKLVRDLAQICEVDQDTARSTLEKNKWNMNEAIDILLYQNNSSDEEENDNQMAVDVDKPQSSSSPKEGASTSSGMNAVSPDADSKKEKESELEQMGGNFTNWAPEKFSILSWNLDGLDDKNLERRTEYVVELVKKEQHDIIFFQELLPWTFDYIARKLTNYRAIPGTEDPNCGYLTGTFLKNYAIYYEDHYLIPYPNTAMERTLLVTKAFIGKAKLALFNTHLESTAEFSNQRQTQLKLCFEMAKGFDKEYNVIFGGDLNLRDKEVGSLLPSSMCDLWVKCESRSTCQYTWDLTRNTNKQMPGNRQPRCRFDRLYFRNSDPPTIHPQFFGLTGIEKVPSTQSFPSDHWGIVSFFELSKEARKPGAKKRKAEGEVP